MNHALLFKILVLCFLCKVVISQNLVENGSFERFTKKLKDIDLYALSSADGWRECRYPGAYINTKLNKHKLKSPPYSGTGMLKLQYVESCPFTKPSGCSTYATTQLKESLIIGQSYAISFWVFLEVNNTVETAITTHIGFKLGTTQEPKGNPNKMISENYYFSDTIVPGVWTKVSRDIRALCELQYLTIGIFKTKEFPTQHRSIYNPVYLYIDEVEIKQIEDIANLSTPYCRYYEKLKPANKPKNNPSTIYFDTNRYVLNQESKKSLKDWKNKIESISPIIVKGFASSEGDSIKNFALSLSRAQEVQRYLIDSLAFPSILANIRAYGEDSTYDDRISNRRVEIEILETSVNKFFYCNAITNIENQDFKLALQNFERWKNLTEKEDQLIAFFDPRLEPLKYHPTWSNFYKELKNDYISQSSFYLDSMFFIDQKYRSLSKILSSMCSVNTKQLESRYSIPFDSLDIYSKETMTAVLESDILRNGFPTISEVGRRQSQALMYIINHGQDTMVIDRYLNDIELLCKKGEAEWKYYAFLYDLNKLLKNKPQYYGTQRKIYDYPEDSTLKELRIYEVDDQEMVNKRRSEIGLDPISDFAAKYYMKVK